MNGFKRQNQALSLCGLNCGLCPMLLGENCGGCGNGNQSCKIARCSLEHGKPEYCYECTCYPCENYRNIDAYDSFITHRRQKADLEKARQIGISRYNLEQQEIREILDHLLAHFNDGRKKTLYCTAVNLLELSDLQEAAKQLSARKELTDLPVKERAKAAAELLQEIGDRRGIVLKLVRKK